MFKARGTKIILTEAHGFTPGSNVSIDGIPHVVVTELPASHAPLDIEDDVDFAPEALSGPGFEIERWSPDSTSGHSDGPSGQYGVSPALSTIELVRAHNAERADDLALAMGMTPALPPLGEDFKARVLAAQAGDLEAIAEMREIGDSIPAGMEMVFAEMIENLLAGD